MTTKSQGPSGVAAVLKVILRDAPAPAPSGPMTRKIRVLRAADELAGLVLAGSAQQADVRALLANASMVSGELGGFWGEVAAQFDFQIEEVGQAPESGKAVLRKAGRPPSDTALGPQSDKERSRRLRQKREARGEKRTTFWLSEKTLGELNELVSADGESRDEIVAKAISKLWRRGKRIAQ